jgi:hypothetical protein
MMFGLKMLGLVRIFTVIVFLLLTTGPEAQACQCPDTSAPPPCALFVRSSIVFTAKVTKIHNTPDKFGLYPEGTLVSLSVQKVFKGTIPRRIVDIQGQETDCRRIYEPGQEYLIYAESYDRFTNTVTTMRCSGRTKVSQATVDLAYFRQVADNSASQFIIGTVMDQRKKPLPQTKVKVRGKAKVYEANTDGEGKYSLRLDEPGEYIVTIVGPFSAAVFSYARGGDGVKTEDGIQYRVKLTKAQCDYRETTVFLQNDH